MDVSRFLSSRRPKAESHSISLAASDGEDGETIVMDNYDPEDADFGTDLKKKLASDAVDREHYGQQLGSGSMLKSSFKKNLNSLAYDGFKTSRSTMGYTENTSDDSDSSVLSDDDSSISMTSNEDLNQMDLTDTDLTDMEMSNKTTHAQPTQTLKDEMQEEEDDQLKVVSDRRIKDRQRGASVRQQFSIFKSLVDVRMAMQPLMQMLEEVTEDDLVFDEEVVEETEQLCIALADAFSKSVGASASKNSLKVLDQLASSIWKSSLDSWHQKALLSDVHLKRQQSSSKKNTAAASAFKVIDQGPFAQVELAMRDKDRLVHRTKMRRLCSRANADDDKSFGDIFDDADFYRILVKDVVGQSAFQDAVTLKATQILKPSSANGDDGQMTAASRGPSKGKRLRYDVHEKLVSFMAPLGLDHSGMWPSERVDSFFSSIFS